MRRHIQSEISHQSTQVFLRVAVTLGRDLLSSRGCLYHLLSFAAFLQLLLNQPDLRLEKLNFSVTGLDVARAQAELVFPKARMKRFQ